MIAEHLPALQVIIPLIAAPVCVLLHRPTGAWLVSLAASWCSFAIALTLLGQVQDGGPISYPLGDWAPPWGIEYRIDMVSAFVLVIVSAIGADSASRSEYARTKSQAEAATREAIPTAAILRTDGLNVRVRQPHALNATACWASARSEQHIVASRAAVASACLAQTRQEQKNTHTAPSTML